MPCRRLLYNMLTAEELAEVDALFAIDPWGDDRADLRMGIIASTVAATASSKPQKPIDFMPYRQKQTADDVTQTHLKVKWTRIAERWNRNHG